MKRARILKTKIKQSAIAEVEADLMARLRVRGGAPRGQLARDLNLAPSTVGIYVERLMAEGLLREGPRVARETGRPATLLTLNPDGGRFVGVDLEGRNAMIVVIDFSQEPLEQVHLELSRAESADSALTKIVAAVEDLVVKTGGPLLGVGVGVPGVVDVARGIGLDYEHIRGWRNVPVARTLSDRLHVPVFLENNIRSMALAEMWFGAARGVGDFICLGVRSGIGAGIVARGRLQHGHDNMAGEIGSWPCPTSSSSTGPRASAPRFASLESLASMTALARGLDGRLEAEQGWDVGPLLEALHRGDRDVRESLHTAAEACGWVAGQLNLALNPELIILAGPLTDLGDAFLQPMMEAVRRSLRPWHSKMPRIEASRLGAFAGAFGAVALAVHRWRPARSPGRPNGDNDQESRTTRNRTIRPRIEHG